ncbi:MAG: SRPBCC domain-containing protein, partial [Pseudomonadota bacterium]
MTDTITKPTEVTLTREIHAPIERVFALWTDREAVMSWFGMDGFVNRDCTIDARPGGVWHVDSRTPDGQDFRMEGTFLAIDPPARI